MRVLCYTGGTMQEKRILLIAHWKMHVTSEEQAVRLFNSIKNVLAQNRTTEMIVLPPHPYLHQVGREVAYKHYAMGAQDAFYEDQGPYTGEVSALMVKNAGAKYVLLGHHSRAHKETREEVAKKITAVLNQGMNPIVCFGEQERGKQWKKQLREQIKESFQRVSKKEPERFVIAYEPAWATYDGENKNPASVEQYQEAMDIIKDELKKLFRSARAVNEMRFLYGGSLDDKNIEEYLKKTDVDGFIVGRAALDPRILMTMFRLIEEGVEIRREQQEKE